MPSQPDPTEVDLNSLFEGVDLNGPSDFLGLDPATGGSYLARGDVEPRFTEEDVDQFFRSSPDALQRAQIRLVRAGLLTVPIYGIPDDDTRTAVRSVYSIANRAGHQNFNEALDAIARQQASAKKMALEGTLPSGGTALVSRDDLMSVMDQTAVTLTGQRLDEQQANAIADAYYGLQRKETADQIGGGDYYQAPSAENFVEQEIQRTMPGEVATEAFANRAFEFFSLLDGVV